MMSTDFGWCPYIVFMLTERQELGLAGEAIAARWLRQRGWDIVAERCQIGHRDIDLIVSRYDATTGGRLIAFVEVRTRSSVQFGGPLDSVGWRKRHQIIKAAKRWVLMNGRSTDTYRFDVVGVLSQNGSSEGEAGEGKTLIQYVPNAFFLDRFG